MDEISQQISEALIELEPQVISPDPNERKLARRLRIERRLEALRRQNEPQHVDVEEKKDKSLTQIQIEKSIEVLKKLLTEGEERVTNIRVASDSRETDRREAEGVNREKIIEALEEEANLAEEAFKQISEKWFTILKSNDPLHINEKMMLQKEKCEELMRQKDGIIAMLKEEIATAEKKFSSDQKKQVDDICLLSDRIEKQVSLTKRAYREQLKLIEESMQAERKMMMEANSKKWEELYKKRDQEEQANSNKKYEQMEQFENQMTDLRREFQEKYRETKIKLERDIDDLEQELERIKALAILNSEKLDYNYQILKKREDENIIIKSQQKRRINKLQDIVNTLKRKISEYGEGTKQQIIKVSGEIVKLQKNILDIESKADHFAEINDAKFNQLWDMNVERVLQVAERILTIDKILHEQLLGLEWVDKGTLKRKELRKENLPSYKNALEVLEQEDSCHLDVDKLRHLLDVAVKFLSRQLLRAVYYRENSAQLIQIHTYSAVIIWGVITKVSGEIVKLQKNILDIESKADHFAEINDAKFNQLWDMNVERVLQVAERILTIDKILHEQLLGLEWVDKGTLKRKELRKENLPSYKNALEVLEQEAKAHNPLPRTSVNIFKSQKTFHELDQKKEAAREHLLRQLMKQISDRAGFILEDRLQQILEPFLETEKTLIRMDNVFSALNITKEADIDELLEYFLPYTHCPLCSTSPAVEGESLITEESEVETGHVSVTDTEGDSSSVTESEVTYISQESRRTVDREKPPHTLMPIAHMSITSVMNEVLDPVDESDSSENDGEKPAVSHHETLDPLENMPPLRPGITQKEDVTASAVSDQPIVEEKLSCQYQHPLIISSVYVLKALRNFVNNYYKPKPRV